ncbi:MAG: replicative DNA helicase, partial [Planctomycetes bacterium]|nr:replicative DNA helicase [Planctomycetota bacterium]
MATAPTNNLSATATGAERVPPHDLDAEMALLGSMMMSRDAIADVVPIIGRTQSAWFYLPAHQQLFEVLLDQYDDPTKAIDLIVVSDELRRRSLLEAIGGHEYMIQLAESFGEWSNAEYYAKIVRDKGMLRDLIRCSGEMAERAYSDIDDVREILDRAEQDIFTVTGQRVANRSISIKQVMFRLAKQLEEGGAATGLRTGFTKLDDMTGGFQPGDLIIIAGRPSMGKTALGLTMARNIVLDRDDPRAVAFFSMEMGADQIAQRLICSVMDIDSRKLRERNGVNEEEQRRLLDVLATFEDAPLMIDDTPGQTVMEVRAGARRMKSQHNIQAVFVDYLQLMHSPKAESRQQEIAIISRGLKSLARELEIPVIALSQLNRMAEGRQDKRPLMSDLRESGAIEQDADVVLLIHREEYYKPEDESVKNQAELIIAKQRNG